MTKVMGTVLVASNLGRGSDEAIRQGAAIARQAGTSLIVCHVLPEMVGIRPLFPQLRELDREDSERVRKMATDALDRQLGRILEPGRGRAEVRLEAGSPHSMVLEIADEVAAGLIVVGHEGDVDGKARGGVGERIARHASCPVLIASERKGKSVLAATDFSDPALPAVRLGQEEADRRGLRFVVVHAVDLQTSKLNLPEIFSPSLINRVIEGRREEARGRLADLGKRLGPTARTVLREGPATDEILQAGDETQAELIVMGTHGRSGISRLALGSVAEGVVRRAKSSTLIVRLQS